MTSTRPVEWRRRARRLRLAGAVVLVAAALLIVTANVLGGVLVAALGVGNLRAATAVSASGQVPRQTRVLILVSGAGFVVTMVAGSVIALLQS